jgi:uncharacterized membrane protein
MLAACQGRHYATQDTLPENSMATNPYAAPQARVADAPVPTPDGQFVPDGQALAAGSGWAWFVDGWRLFRAQPGLWIGISVALLAFYVLVSLIPWIGQLATTLLTPVIAGGLLLGCKALDEGGTLTFGHLFEGFRLPQAGRLVMVGVVSLAAAVVMLVSIFLVVGAGFGVSMLGGTPGMGGLGLTTALAILIALAVSIPVYMALWFAPALVTLHDFGTADALKASFTACLKNMLPFLVYGIAALLLSVVALVPFGLGLLVLVPVFIASVYAAYRDIFFIR